MTRVRFWFLYTTAWIPYALSYFVLFRYLPGNLQAVRQTVYNILPAAILGALVVPWSGIFSWRFHRRLWFYPAQLGSAVVYSLLWYAGVLLISSVGQTFITHHFRIGYFSSYALQWQFFSGLMIYGNIAGIAYVLQVNERLGQEQRRRELAESLQTNAELASLRAQLNPHFLFNALNSIMALAGPGQPHTMQAIAQLAAMLRYTLQQSTETEGTSLRQELDFTEQYLALESLRLGERLRIYRDFTPAALVCLLPPLTLQPLVENAIRHGISQKVKGGTLRLCGRVLGDALHLEIEDDGGGADSAVFESAVGIGIRTVKQRLDLFSNGKAEFVVRSAPGCGCSIMILLPQDLAEQTKILDETSWMVTS